MLYKLELSLLGGVSKSSILDLIIAFLAIVIQQGIASLHSNVWQAKCTCMWLSSNSQLQLLLSSSEDELAQAAHLMYLSELDEINNTFTNPLTTFRHFHVGQMIKD